MVVRIGIWLSLPLAVCASQSILCAQQFGQTEGVLSIVEVENVDQDEPTANLLALVEPVVEPVQDSESQLEPSTVEDLVDADANKSVGEPGSNQWESAKASEDASDRAQADKSDAQRRSDTTREQLAKLRRPLKHVELNGLEPVTTANSGDVTLDSSAEDPNGQQSRWITATGADGVSPTAEVTHYSRRRLYFEDSSLERCGKSDGYFRAGIWTNGKSAAKFLMDTTLLPYRMLRQRPDQLVSVRAK